MNTYENADLTPDTTVDRAADATARAVDAVKDKAAATSDVVKEQAKRVAAQVGDQAKTTVETRKNDVAQELGSVAEVVRQTSYEAAMGSSPTIMEYGQRIANQIEGVSTYLDDHGVEEILSDVQSFARRQPAVFLGGAFMLGLAVGRFLRSSGGQHFDAGTAGYNEYSSSYRTFEPNRYESRTAYPATPSSESMTSFDSMHSQE